MLQAINLYKSFGNRRVLQGLNLKVESGEIVALIGVNGAGKSTLIRILSTLTRPDAGRISLNGIPVNQDPVTSRRRIGVVLHAPMVYGNLTGKENLQFFCRVFGIINYDQTIARVLEEVNLTSRADDLVRAYSRGMQQRLSIARALLHDPEILLLDEPLTGLDDDSVLRLHESLTRAAQQGKSILFATHDLEHACKLATRVDILHEGVIKDSQNNVELSPEILHDIFRMVTARDEQSAAGRIAA